MFEVIVALLVVLTVIKLAIEMFALCHFFVMALFVEVISQTGFWKNDQNEKFA